MNYSHVAEAVFLRPWAIQREVHETIRGVLAEHVRRGHLSADEVQERLAAAPQRRGTAASDSATVAVIPIRGVIMPRASLMSAMSGGTSIEGIRRDLRGALANDEVDGIVFDIESPGGVVDGVPELAAEIRASRGAKPIIAAANAYAASAAYWLAAQADEIYVTPSGDVGSIGVFTAHEDWSAFWEEFGMRTTLISAGKYKVEGNEFEPLAEDAQAYIQSRVDEFYGMFVRDVAAGRGVSASDVREGFGQGRMVLAKAAVTEKMADRVGTVEDAIQRAARQGALNRRDRNRQASLEGTRTFVIANPLAGEAQELAAERERLRASGDPEDEPIVDVNEALTPDPDADDGTAATDAGEVDEEAAGPDPDFYAVRARRRDREAHR